MVRGRLFWQIPLTILACIAGSLVAVVNQVMRFTMNASVVAALSGVISAAAIALELRVKREA